ncbi:MAG: ABC transporter substrate-binding protein [Lentisphaeria bacterium]|jgi:ribose transport system substrate-binding protein|nr:ABC transporter substrate-binding protein [Lentisphaeria bacterium]
MKRFPKLAGMALLSLGLVALAGCGKPQNYAADGDIAPAARVKIGVSVPAATHGWTAGIGWWAQRAMALYPNIEWVYSTADGPDRQVSDIEDMMTQGIDALVILATESAPLTDVAERASQRGIYIVNVDRGFTKPVANIFLEGDNQAFGRMSAEFMVEKLGGKGKIVILRGMSCTVDTLRYEAAMEVFNAAGIEVLGTLPGMWNRSKALECMQAFLAQHKQIDAVWASDDDMAVGCEQAIREAGREKEMWIFGGAGMKEIIKKVMDGDPMYPANVTYSPSMIATGIHLAVASMRDGKSKQVSEFMPKHLILDCELVTPENAKNYYFPDAIY